MTQAGPPAGWFPDDELEGTQRYWDGEAWTEHRAPAAPQRETSSGDNLLIGIGYAAALLLPIIGFVIGLILMGKGEKNHGAWIAVASIAVGLVACAAVVYA